MESSMMALENMRLIDDVHPTENSVDLACNIPWTLEVDINDFVNCVSKKPATALTYARVAHQCYQLFKRYIVSLRPIHHIENRTVDHYIVIIDSVLFPKPA